MDFTNIQYLQKGTTEQQSIYQLLNEIKIFDNLKEFTPILTGTFPIDIAIPGSDLDIICQCNNHQKFYAKINDLYNNQSGFNIKTTNIEGVKTTIAVFEYKGFIIEIFGQKTPSIQQNAYKHMLIEYQILQEKDNIFKEKIITLKKQGLKTEPAFAQLLNLKGNPYQALLKYYRT